MASKHSRANLELGAILNQTFGVIHQRFAHDTLAIMHESGLTMPQMVTLFALHKFGPHTVCGIAERLHLSAAAASHLIERLVLGGFVGRVEDAGDRRQKRISICPLGEELLSRFHHSRSEELTAAVEKLSAALRRELREVLVKVMAELREGEPQVDPLGSHRVKSCRGEGRRGKP